MSTIRFRSLIFISFVIATSVIFGAWDVTIFLIGVWATLAVDAICQAIKAR